MASSESTISSYWIEMEDRSQCSRYLEDNMGLGYDIFQESSDGPLWMAQAATLAEAQEKLEMMAQRAPGNYFVRDAASAKIVGRSGPSSPEEVGR